MYRPGLSISIVVCAKLQSVFQLNLVSGCTPEL